jgi:hypothetical protein
MKFLAVRTLTTGDQFSQILLFLEGAPPADVLPCRSPQHGLHRRAGAQHSSDVSRCSSSDGLGHRSLRPRNLIGARTEGHRISRAQPGGADTTSTTSEAVSAMPDHPSGVTNPCVAGRWKARHLSRRSGTKCVVVGQARSPAAPAEHKCRAPSAAWFPGGRCPPVPWPETASRDRRHHSGRRC